MSERPISQIIADLKSTCHPQSDIGVLCAFAEEALDLKELKHDLQLANKNASACMRVANERLERIELLEQALRWALSKNAGWDYGVKGGLRDGGCGCCSGQIDQPAHLEPIFRDILGEKT